MASCSASCGSVDSKVIDIDSAPAPQPMVGAKVLRRRQPNLWLSMTATSKLDVGKAEPVDSNRGASDGIRVFLTDDQEIVRRGLASLIATQPDMTVVGQAESASSTLATIAQAAPNVAVIDLRLDDGDGIAVCREIRSAHPEIGCLILTSYDDDRAIVDASLAGAAGYVLKQIRSEPLLECIRGVAEGRQLLDPGTVRMCLRRLKEGDAGVLESLTAQEKRIFELIGDGLSNREIADELILAEKTVKNYVSNLLTKLGLSRRTQAAAIAARLDERERNRFT